MYLFLDPTKDGELILALMANQLLEVKPPKVEHYKIKTHISEELLKVMEKFLGKRENTLKGIIVVNGPGRFTTLRVALTTLNAMAWALNIPLVGVKAQETWQKSLQIGLKKIKREKAFHLVLPYYGQPPTITLPKKKK